MFSAKSFIGLCLFSAASFLAPSTSKANITTPVTLAGLNIDTSYVGTLVDPGSGVSFSKSSTNGGTNMFIVDYFNSYSTLPDITPGLVLSSGGYVGNGGISVPQNFGFTMTFPAPVSAVNMIAAYVSRNSTGDTLTLNAYDVNGTLLGNTVVTPPVGAFVEDPISFSESTNEIASLSVVPNNIGDVFGKISSTILTSVPEPTTLGLAAMAAVSLCVRRRAARLLST